MFRYRHHGFTLIELLVVLVILGIAVAMIGVNFAPNPEQALDNEAQRLALLLEQARDEAMSTGSGTAFSVEDGGYRFWQRQSQIEPDATPDDKWPGKSWTAHADREVFRPRQFPSPVVVAELRVNGQVADKQAMRIIFSPSGRMPSFRLLLASGTHGVAVSGSAAGRIAVEREPG